MEPNKASTRNAWDAVASITTQIRDGSLDPALTDWITARGFALTSTVFSSVCRFDDGVYTGTLVDTWGRNPRTTPTPISAIWLPWRFTTSANSKWLLNTKYETEDREFRQGIQLAAGASLAARFLPCHPPTPLEPMLAWRMGDGIRGGDLDRPVERWHS